MDTADTFLRFYAMQTRKPGETVEGARERARAELPTLARLAENEPGRLPLRLVRAL